MNNIRSSTAESCAVRGIITLTLMEFLEGVYDECVEIYYGVQLSSNQVAAGAAACHHA